jgi:hypothetical protein
MDDTTIGIIGREMIYDGGHDGDDDGFNLLVIPWSVRQAMYRSEIPWSLPI